MTCSLPSPLRLLPPCPPSRASHYPELFAEAAAAGAPAPRVDFADVGCGFGGLTVRLAEAYPDKVVLGMELRDKVTGGQGCGLAVAWVGWPAACCRVSVVASHPLPACLPFCQSTMLITPPAPSTCSFPLPLHLLPHLLACRVCARAHPGTAPAAAGPVPQLLGGAHQCHEVPHQLLCKGAALQALLPLCGEAGAGAGPGVAGLGAGGRLPSGNTAPRGERSSAGGCLGRGQVWVAGRPPCCSAAVNTDLA